MSAATRRDQKGAAVSVATRTVPTDATVIRAIHCGKQRGRGSVVAIQNERRPMMAGRTKRIGDRPATPTGTRTKRKSSR